MSSVGQVHWHEGLFLQPHHLQTMQRELLDASWRERRMTWMFPYGVIELKLSTDALENMLVRIDRLRAVMPSGIEIDIPGRTLHLAVPDAELARRRAAMDAHGWHPAAPPRRTVDF
jgi:predicted component of type VI protein secretion system